MSNQCRDQNRPAVVLVDSKAIYEGKIEYLFCFVIFLGVVFSISHRIESQALQISLVRSAKVEQSKVKEENVNEILTGISSIVLSEIHIYILVVSIFIFS